MHREFKKRLAESDGESVQAVVAFVDVREFSTWARHHQAHEIAMFIKRAYARFLESIGQGAFFWKPTGDGMLIAFHYDEKTITSQSVAVVSRAVLACAEFGTAFTNDEVLCFDVPTKLGCGVARGTVCRLVSRGKTLDLSGHVVNLAARLTEQARPDGVVVDSGILASLAGSALKEKFSRDSIYLDGVAEETPIAIGYEQSRVRVEEDSRRPIGWEWTVVSKMQIPNLEVWRKSFAKAKTLWIPLSGPLSAPTDFTIELTFPSRTESGELIADRTRVATLDKEAARYLLTGGLHGLELNVPFICSKLDEGGAAKDDAVAMCIRVHTRTRRSLSAAKSSTQKPGVP